MNSDSLSEYVFVLIPKDSIVIRMKKKGWNATQLVQLIH